MPVAKKGRPRKNKDEISEPDSDLYTFETNEIILCHHRGELYKAKILNRTIHKNLETGSEDPHYFVHYWGWNAQWDEWVEADRCLKHSPQNLQKQKEMKQKNKAQASNKSKKKNKKKRKRQIEDSDESESEDEDEDDGQNHGNEADMLQTMIEEKRDLGERDLDDLDLNQKIKIHQHKREKKSEQSIKNRHSRKRLEIEHQHQMERRKFMEKLKTITIPIALRDNLVEQYNLIHSQQKLIKLPKANGFRINDILSSALRDQQQKLRNKQSKKPPDVDGAKSLQTMCELLPFINDGIRGFFKNTLQINLLYNFEKPQLDMLEVDEHTDLCDIYGAEHLIRLFYILPNILIHTRGVEEKNFGQIKQCLSVITQFVSKNKSKYLINYHKGKDIEQCVEEVDAAYLAKYKKIAKLHFKWQLLFLWLSLYLSIINRIILATPSLSGLCASCRHICR